MNAAGAALPGAAFVLSLVSLNPPSGGSRIRPPPQYQIEPIWYWGGGRIREPPDGGLSDTSDKTKAAPGSAAPAAFIHHPRHYGRRRLCLAEGPRLAGGAARPQYPGCGYKKISRS